MDSVDIKILHINRTFFTAIVVFGRGTQNCHAPGTGSHSVEGAREEFFTATGSRTQRNPIHCSSNRDHTGEPNVRVPAGILYLDSSVLKINPAHTHTHTLTRTHSTAYQSCSESFKNSDPLSLHPPTAEPVDQASKRPAWPRPFPKQGRICQQSEEGEGEMEE